MKPSTLVLALLVAVALAVALVLYRKVTEESRAWRELVSLEGQDLRQRTESWALFRRALRRESIDAEAGATHNRVPFHVVRLAGWVVLLEADSAFSITDCGRTC